MKKVILILLLLSLSGCTIVKIDTKDIDNIVEVVTSKNNVLFNRVGNGYKYYIPRGMNYIDTVDLNDIIYSNGLYYNVYIDAVSFYYETNHLKENNDYYYYKEINNNEKQGYLIIEEISKDEYNLEFYYNHARIEVITNKAQINEAVLNSSYILSTVKYNPSIIKLMLDEGFFTEVFEIYDEFHKRNETDNYIKFEE